MEAERKALKIPRAIAEPARGAQASNSTAGTGGTRRRCRTRGEVEEVTWSAGQSQTKA